MVYYDYNYKVMCHEDDYLRRLDGCAAPAPPYNNLKQDMQKRWTQVWVKSLDKNVAISGVISSYGLFVDYTLGSLLDLSGKLTVGSSTFWYTKVDGVPQVCERGLVPTNLLIELEMHGKPYTTYDIHKDEVTCPYHGRFHQANALLDNMAMCSYILNKNTGEYIPTWSADDCYYKTLDDVKIMTRLLTPEQVMQCYGEVGWKNDYECNIM